MNGRVYDYNVGRFMSVDPVIQAPMNSQSINPYSYIMNNPLAGIDPSGYTSVDPETERKITVTTAGSRIKRSVTVSASQSGGTVNLSVAGGNGASERGAVAAIEKGAGSIGFVASDIGGEAVKSSENRSSEQNISGYMQLSYDPEVYGFGEVINASGAGLFESNSRHAKAVKMHVEKLKKLGFSKFEYDVKINVDLGDGETAIRYADIAAMRKGQSLADAEFHEIKTVQKKRKSSFGRSLLRKLSRFEDITQIVTKIGRGATIVNQLRKDAALSEFGGFIPRSNQQLESNRMIWSIYQYDNKRMRQAGQSIPVYVGNENIRNTIRDEFLQR